MIIIDEKINKILKDYETKYWDIYKSAGERTVELLKSELKSTNVKHVLTNRTKEIDSLKGKLEKYYGQDKKIKGKSLFEYDTIDILNEIKDLAGTRVSLFFPVDRMIVEPIIYEKFENVTFVNHPGKGSEEEWPIKSLKRFEGYCADHYSILLKDSATIFGNLKYQPRVEIQVASLLMHAWMEVDHDLVYKPKSEDKELKFDDLAILDTVNGLVIAGEVAFDSLKQKLINREILTMTKRTETKFATPLLRSTKKELWIIGQNLYSLTKNQEFELQLFKVLKDKQVRVKIVVANPEAENLNFLSYGFGLQSFSDDLDNSIKILKAWQQKARKNNLSLEVEVCDSIERETVFFSDPENTDGLLYLKRVPLGTEPENRTEVKIEKQRHLQTFNEFWDKYKNSKKYKPLPT